MISVCMATYNGERYIKYQLLSILPQLNNNDEIVISDDKSTDKTLDIIKSLDSDIIKVFINNGEHGYTPNFENALRHAHGDYIFLSDQDDIWEPNKVSRCMEYLERYDLVISDAVVIDKKLNTIAPSYYIIRKSRSGLINNIIRFSYLGCCMAFKSRILDIALPFPSNHQYCTHDNWLAIVSMTFYKVAIIDDKLIRYRRYDNNTSQGGLKNTTTMKFKIAYRLYLIYWIVKRLLKYLFCP